ncbi:MAG: DUF6518 family protein [Actinomycetes bacterium]
MVTGDNSPGAAREPRSGGLDVAALRAVSALPPSRDPRPRRRVLHGAVLLAAGLFAGVLTEMAQGSRVDAVETWSGSVATWAALAFVAGATCRTRPGAVAGGVSVLAGLVAGYHLAQAGDGVAVAVSSVSLWLLAAVPGGLAFGAAGLLWRTGGSWRGAGGLALLGALLVGEGLHRRLDLPWQAGTGVAMLVVGLLVPVLLGDRVEGRLRAVLLTVALAPLGLLCIRGADALLPGASGVLG